MSLLCACAVQKILNFVKWPIDTIDIFGCHTCNTPCCQHVFSAAVQPSFYFLLVLTCVCNVLSRFPDSSHRSRFSSHLYFRNVFAQLERHRTKTIGKRYFLRSDSSQQTARALRVVSASSYDASSWCGSSGHPRRTPFRVQSDSACALPQRRLRPLSCRVSQV